MPSEGDQSDKRAPGGVQRAVHGLRWLTSTRLISQLISWGMTAITIRLLRPVDYGIVATAGLFTVTAGLFLDSGLNAVLVSWKELSADMQAAAETMVLLISIALALLIDLVAPAAGVGFRDPALVEALTVSAWQLPLSGLTVVPLALLLRRMSFRRIAISQSVASLGQGLFTLGMAYSGEAYWALIYGTLFGYALRATLFWFSLNAYPRVSLNFGHLRPLLQSGRQLLGHRLLQYVSTECDICAIGRFHGAAVLGSYSLAKTLSQTPLDQLASAVNQVTLPSFASKRDDTAAQTNGMLLVVSTTSTLVFPLFWLAGAVSPSALPLIFGPGWAPVVFPFMAFAIMLPLRSVYDLLDTAVIGLGASATSLRNAMVRAGVMIPLIVAGAFFGANWAAVAWVVGFPVVFLLCMLRISRRFRIGLRTLLRPMGPPAISAATSCVIVTMIAALFRSAMPPVLLLGLVGAAGALSYLLMIRLVGRGHYLQVTALAAQFLAR